jgi:hypothetical protein
MNGIPSSIALALRIVYTRASSETPKLNAFCRVAPSVRLSFRAILRAGVRLRANAFNVLTSDRVQDRLFDPFFTAMISPKLKKVWAPYNNASGSVKRRQRNLV